MVIISIILTNYYFVDNGADSRNYAVNWYLFECNDMSVSAFSWTQK